MNRNILAWVKGVNGEKLSTAAFTCPYPVEVSGNDKPNDICPNNALTGFTRSTIRVRAESRKYGTNA